MEKIIGIRREDKNEWEKRVPLMPDDVKGLKKKYGIHTIIQPSKIRVYSDDEYRKAGAEINEDLSKASLILAVKEIPETMFKKGKTYLFFSHTIKGQSYNMPSLKKMMDLKTNLIDYERIVNENNQRLIFFGNYAGLAGMIESFHSFGKKLKLMGLSTPFEKIKSAYQYKSLKHAKEEIKKVGEEIEDQGLPQEICPLVVGFTGYGNVSNGAQEIFNLLPHKVLSANILDNMYESLIQDRFSLYKVVFKEEDIVKPLKGEFDLQDYYNNPEKYVSKFENYIPYLQILINCIYWTEDYPRLITKEYLKNNTILKSNLNLKVIGDVSCDINGSIEITYKSTKPDKPDFTYFAEEDRFKDGPQRRGVTVVAVDNLPCEFPMESSSAFSSVLKSFVNDIICADFDNDFEYLKLPFPIKKALILHRGELMKDYKYLNKFLNKEEM